MAKPQIDPEKLLAFLNKLYAGLQYSYDHVEILPADPPIASEIKGKLEEMLSDVGDQILMLPEELRMRLSKIPTKAQARAAYKKGHPRA
jgi:hypothetical protein